MTTRSALDSYELGTWIDRINAARAQRDAVQESLKVLLTATAVDLRTLSNNPDADSIISRINEARDVAGQVLEEIRGWE